MNTTYAPSIIETGLSSEILQALKSQQINEAPRLVVAGEVIEIPEKLARVFRSVLENFARGKPVTVVTQEMKMTTQELADFLMVSRPTAIKLLEKYNIPFATINRHRRIAFVDAQRLEGLLLMDQEKALRDMYALQGELGMLDEEYEDGQHS